MHNVLTFVDKSMTVRDNVCPATAVWRDKVTIETRDLGVTLETTVQVMYSRNPWHCLILAVSHREHGVTLGRRVISQVNLIPLLLTSMDSVVVSPARCRSFAG